MRLEDLAALHGTDKLTHGYMPHYQHHLGHLENEPISLLEVGVQTGVSLRMWQAFFRRGLITGVDIDPVCANLDLGERVRVVIADVKQFHPSGTFDIIVDDGSHLAVDIRGAVAALWGSLRPGGWYVIEDWQVQFDPSYGGGPEGSVATDMARHWLYRLLGDQRGPMTEMHVYPKIVFARKA
ncbi:MAG: class I SAM-dependent methyltransferase [Euryarchaeota archaeon]|nr:class I SAM-dependent methyltransferase [Euryarchaeota archaeon]